MFHVKHSIISLFYKELIKNRITGFMNKREKGGNIEKHFFKNKGIEIFPRK